MQKLYISSVAWSIVLSTKLLTLTSQNGNEWRVDRKGGKGNQNALLFDLCGLDDGIGNGKYNAYV